MFLSGQSGHPGDLATLASHNTELYEGFTKCVSFWFWLEAGEQDCILSLAVFTEDLSGNVVSPWTRNLCTAGWTKGQAAYTSLPL